MSEESLPRRFAGRTAIVTGAGSGIGRATAVRFSKEGARVIASDLRRDRLDTLATELAAHEVTIVAGDVALEETARAIVAAANGRVDVLANIAGIMDSFLPVGEVDDATWERVFSVNLTSMMRLMRATIPLMLASGKGAIVNVSSEAGLRGSAAGAAYTASKHAVIGLTKNTAFLYGTKGIRVNAIAPGPVATGIEAPMKSALARERVGALMPAILPEVATAEQLAVHICWLASDEALNINGIVMPSDGGWSAT